MQRLTLMFILELSAAFLAGAHVIMIVTGIAAIVTKTDRPEFAVGLWGGLAVVGALAGLVLGQSCAELTPLMRLQRAFLGLWSFGGLAIGVIAVYIAFGPGPPVPNLSTFFELYGTIVYVTAAVGALVGATTKL